MYSLVDCTLFMVHPNMHWHTGAAMSMGTGSRFSRSLKQNMVPHSSTKSELIGVYDVLPQVLWTKKLLEDQGLTVKETVLYQDNMSLILLKKNGKQSSSKCPKHMDIQFSYVTEHVQNKTLSMKHCPTEEMVADFFTKPLQGSLFVRLHNFIMGLSMPIKIVKSQEWLDEDDWSQPLEANLEAEDSEAKFDTDKCMPMGVAMVGIENTTMTENENNCMKENEENINTYRAHGCASRSMWK